MGDVPTAIAANSTEEHAPVAKSSSAEGSAPSEANYEGDFFNIGEGD